MHKFSLNATMIKLGRVNKERKPIYINGDADEMFHHISSILCMKRKYDSKNQDARISRNIF